ncbi:MAG: alpha-ketoacid dehydrogenase subunit beta [Chloroflexi bacterium]|nr:alpha-ketoacid dehydrogenase subunit beta [Chloroflexota bacterium]
MREVTYSEAVRDAMREEMRRDERVFLLGEDIGRKGGVYGVTRGLLDEFGAERIRDCPISESAIIGCGIGAALNGMIPICEISNCDFMLVCADQIINQAAKMRYMSGGQASVPMVIRTTYGVGRGSGAQHSQSLYGTFLPTAGLKIVLPATPYDAKGLLKAAIRDPDPVLFFEHRFLYAQKESIPEEDFTVPLGVAKVEREGNDISVIASGRMVRIALAAAEELASRGIKLEVIDIRCLVPLDRDAIVNSVIKTGRAIVADESPLAGGAAAEIGMVIQESAFHYLNAPIERIGLPNVPAPLSRPLEMSLLPTSADICAASLRMLRE